MAEYSRNFLTALVPGFPGASIQLFVKLGLTVVSAFALLLLPWIGTPADLLQVVARVFPFARGLFEDKVANVWCAMNVIVKLRRVFDHKHLVQLR